MTKRELRIVNPNTDPSVTRWLREEASRIAGDAFEVVAVNADSGLLAIQTPAEIEFVARAVLSAISAAPRPWGAVVAAFGDPGLSEARARLAPLAGLPVWAAGGFPSIYLDGHFPSNNQNSC